MGNIYKLYYILSLFNFPFEMFQVYKSMYESFNCKYILLDFKLQYQELYYYKIMVVFKQ